MHALRETFGMAMAGSGKLRFLPRGSFVLWIDLHSWLACRTYTLGRNYAKATDQSILTDGENINKDLCKGFDSLGLGRGVSASMVDNTGV